MALEDSILTSVKNALGLAEDYENFDQEVMMHINATLGTLNQLGVGPPDGFMIEDKATLWTEFLGVDEPNLNPAKSYTFMRVKLIYDINTLTGPVIGAIEKQIKELEWRLMVEVDPIVPDDLPEDDEDFYILDGGGA